MFCIPRVGQLSWQRTDGDRGLANNTAIETNLVFNTHHLDWSSLRQGAFNKKDLKRSWPGRRSQVGLSDDEDTIREILKGFGIEFAPKSNPKERKTLLSKLQAAIRNDLIAHNNEQPETMKRTAGLLALCQPTDLQLHGAYQSNLGLGDRREVVGNGGRRSRQRCSRR